jgi:hypothetical protein
LVEDLGTEFGVEVLESGETASHVFQGQVVMKVAGAGDVGRGAGNENPKSQIPNQQILLSAGQSARVAPGKDEVLATPAVPTDAERFVRAMTSPKAVQDSLAYEKLVLSLGPAVYYRMERHKSGQRSVASGQSEQFSSPVGRRTKHGVEPENGTSMVYDSAPGGHHGQLRLGNQYGGSPFVAGRFGTALMLRGPDVGDRAIVPDFPKSAADKLTISAWVMAAGRPGWGMIASDWGRAKEGAAEEGRFLFGLYRRDGDLFAQITQRDGQMAQLREGADVPLPIFAWQHVAVVVDANVAYLYRNGKQAASCPLNGMLSPAPIGKLGIGCRINAPSGNDAIPNTYGYNYWHGRIDELAIFERALSAEQIQQLYLGGAVPPETNNNTTTP